MDGAPKGPDLQGVPARFGPFRLTDECRAVASAWTFDDLAPAKARSLRVFRHEIVERVLARAHPITPIVWFGPVAVWAALRAAEDGLALVEIVALFAAGWLLWSFLEYWLHRLVFHRAPTDVQGRVRSFLVHGYHHKYPNDRLRLVAPPMMSWPLGVVVAALCRLALGELRWAPVFAGVALGYVAYDWIHYYAHHFRPRGAIGRFLRAYHLRHHHEHAASRFGVSSPLWDLVFGTYAPPDRRALGRRSASRP